MLFDKKKKKIHSSCFVIAKSEFQRILISVVKQMWSGKGKIAQSCLTVCDPMDYSPQNSPGQNTGVGSLSLLQGLFPTQGSNPGLPHWRRTLYQLTHKGSPRILEWAAYSFFSSSSRSRNQTGVSCIAGGFLTNWAIRKATRKEIRYSYFWIHENKSIIKNRIGVFNSLNIECFRSFWQN